MSCEHGVCVWDLTLDASKITRPELQDLVNTHCKKWAYQLEKGEQSGYLHYQCRVSLKVRSRLKGVIKLFQLEGRGKATPTSTDNRDNCFYVTKEDTRVEGPWMDTDDTPKYIPRQIREIVALKPWQQSIVNDANIWDTRHINILINESGNIGKSILKTYIGVHGIGRAFPYVNDYKDIMRMVMDTKKVKLYIIDIPRAIRKENMFQFLAGIETLKDGYAYDDRYKFREEYFDCPNIWIFTNVKPDSSMLSKDRWRYWNVANDKLYPVS